MMSSAKLSASMASPTYLVMVRRWHLQCAHTGAAASHCDAEKLGLVLLLMTDTSCVFGLALICSTQRMAGCGAGTAELGLVIAGLDDNSSTFASISILYNLFQVMDTSRLHALCCTQVC